MYHKADLTVKERIDAWTALNAFTYKIMKDNFGKKKFLKRMNRIRQEELKRKALILRKLSEVAI